MAGSRGGPKMALALLAVLSAGAWNSSLSSPLPHAEVHMSRSLEGRVVVRGEPPAVPPIDMSGNPFCLERHGEAVESRRLEVSPDGGVAGVLVYIANPPSGVYVDVASREEMVLDQVDCLYTPSVVAVRTGQEIVIRNSDATLHNVRVSPESNEGFNIGQPLAGISSRRAFGNPETGIQVRCDIHAWMEATIHVFDHDFFAISDEDGGFSLPPLPVGEYQVDVWHPHLGALRTSIAVDELGAPLLLEYAGS